MSALEGISTVSILCEYNPRIGGYVDVLGRDLTVCGTFGKFAVGLYKLVLAVVAVCTEILNGKINILALIVSVEYNVISSLFLYGVENGGILSVNVSCDNEAVTVFALIKSDLTEIVGDDSTAGYFYVVIGMLFIL